MSGSYRVGKPTGTAVLVTTLPSAGVRQGIFPSAGGVFVQVPIPPDVKPYLDLLTLPNG